MDCELCLDQLSAYCDGQLDEKQMNAVKAHLETCESCQEEYKALQYMIEVLKEPSVVEIPKNLHQQIMTKIKSEAKPKVKPVVKWKDYFKGGSLIAASLIMALCITRGSDLWWHKEQLTQNVENTRGINESSSKEAESEVYDQSIAVASVGDEAPPGNRSRGVDFSEWQVETKDKVATYDFVKDFCQTHHLSCYEEEGTLLIEANEEGETLEKALNDLSFVEKVRIIEGSRENIKISMIEP